MLCGNFHCQKGFNLILFSYRICFVGLALRVHTLDFEGCFASAFAVLMKTGLDTPFHGAENTPYLPKFIVAFYAWLNVPSGQPSGQCIRGGCLRYPRVTRPNVAPCTLHPAPCTLHPAPTSGPKFNCVRQVDF